MVESIVKSDPFAEREAQKYENPIPSREFILAHLAECGRPRTLPELIIELALEDPDKEEALRRRLIAMTRDGQLLRNRKGAYGPLASMELISGRVIGHKDGFGFVVPDAGGDDLFLTPRQMRQVFHGDRVLTRVANIDTRGKREATIVEVLEHATQQLVGRLFTEAGVAYVVSANQRINHDVLIPPDGIGEAKHGQLVIVSITDQPTKNTQPLGTIVEILGDHMAPGMEINVAIRNHDLPYHFSEEVIAEAARYKAEVSAEDIEGRVDFRHLPFVTIDGEDAKDFDDAVYCEPRKAGGFTLYVAIADVSFYVKPGTALDGEAYKRGNSVYFPARVIPMLPETLSNNLCSLNPQVDRLVMVCEMTIQASGRISRYAFSEGVIHSHARLTYTQVHRMMEKNDLRMRERFKDNVSVLENLYNLFHILKASRTARGAIDFDMPETKIVYGSDRKIEKILPYERYDSHRVIEECMLCANICAARYVEKNKVPALYRVHEGPKTEKLEKLRRYLTAIGLNLPAHRPPTPSDYAGILRAVSERPDAQIIQTMLLRSMSQAIYSTDNKGHFGLAYDAYAHFTSPIRRYPDLLIHRNIKHILQKSRKKLNADEFIRAGEHCSMTERRADDATNEVKDWLKCEFMLDKVGQEFSGRVAGVTSFGVFVELHEFYVEGLIHISNLPNDYYQFDPIKHTLHGEHSGRIFTLGSPVNIRVARVDLDKVEIDFVLVETQAEEQQRQSRLGVADKNKKNLKKKMKKEKRSLKAKSESGSTPKPSSNASATKRAKQKRRPSKKK